MGGVGAYRTEEGKPWILPVVKKAEKILAEKIEQELINHEYLPVLGMDSFSKAATSMLLGEDSPALAEGRAFGIQSLSGTGALRNGAEFLKRILGATTVYYSDPTWGNHGLIFKNTVLNDPDLYQEWRDCIRTMSSRIIDMRSGLRKRIEDLGTPGDWSHITTQIGMFSYVGLSEEQCIFLQKEKHLYLLKSSRISMCGVTPGNIDYVAKAIHEAVTKFQQ